MWKEYSMNHIKNNKSTSISIMVAALIASLFISLICGVFYNMWADNIARLIQKEGDWQGRLVGSISKDDIKTIESFSNVEKVIFEMDDTSGKTVVSVYFNHWRSIYKELPQIARKIGLDTEKGNAKILFHNELLSEYFIFSPEEKKNPPLLLTFYVLVMLAACFSLVLIIRSAFGVSMNTRIQQLGILQSVGATPRQIRTALMQEAFILCTAPVLIGIGAGLGLCLLFLKFANHITVALGEAGAAFHYSPAVFLVTIFMCLFTVLLSAWLPARKLSKLSPMEAIRGNAGEPTGKKKKKSLLPLLFGLEGELAVKSMQARKKAYWTSALSLGLAFLVFSIFLDFMTLSGISTKHTYFERYKDTWDFMVTVRNMDSQDRELRSGIRNISGVLACTAYRKETAYTYLTEEMQSDELRSLGGIAKLKEDTAEKSGEYLIEVPLIILDDASFEEYCSDAGVAAGALGEPAGVAVNTIWDSENSNFRYKQYIPFLTTQENRRLALFTDTESATGGFSLKIGAYTDQTPNLREEYNNYSLVQILSESTYISEVDPFYESGNEMYFNITTDSSDKGADIQEKLSALLEKRYDYTLEGRAEEEAFNEAVSKGYLLLTGTLCGLLACIGIASVFSNTLGFLYQRKREFARYLSVGMTPGGMKKLLLAEAVRVGVKPLLISIPFNLLFVVFAVNASYLDPMEFIEQMPVIPLTVFAVIILGAVGAAYYIGGRKLRQSDMAQILKNDAMY